MKVDPSVFSLLNSNCLAEVSPYDRMISLIVEMPLVVISDSTLGAHITRKFGLRDFKVRSYAFSLAPPSTLLVLPSFFYSLPSFIFFSVGNLSLPGGGRVTFSNTHPFLFHLLNQVIRPSFF